MKQNIFLTLKRNYERVKEIQRRPRTIEEEAAITTRCLNCGHEFTGTYCPHCGQKADTKRFSTRDTIRSLLVSFIGQDNTIFNTCFELLYRPGHMIRDFICGMRTRYIRPVQMLLCLVAIYALASYAIDDDYSPFSMAVESSVESNSQSPSLNRTAQFVSGLLSNNVTLAIISAILCVPPFKWIFRRKKIKDLNGNTHSLNTAEHFYAQVYISCMNMILSLIILPLWISDKSGDLLQYINLIALVILPTWAYRQLYEVCWLQSILRCLLALSLSIIIIVILLLLSFGLFYGFEAIS